MNHHWVLCEMCFRRMKLFYMLCFDIKCLFFSQKMFVPAHMIHVHFTSFIYLCDHLVFLWYGLGIHKQHPKSQHCYHLWETSVYSFSDHHPGTNWVFGAGVVCNLTTKINSHQVWINYQALSVYKSDKSNETVSWCRNDFYKITIVNLLSNVSPVTAKLH